MHYGMLQKVQWRTKSPAEDKHNFTASDFLLMFVRRTLSEIVVSED